MQSLIWLFWLGSTCLLLAASSNDVVQVLVPGFTVQEIPIKLPNANNLRFAPDGRLTVLGYDGRIHLLKDTNGDGVEDTAEVFWDQQTLSVPVGMCWGPEGLYVSSHGKVSLLRDDNQDGRADREEIIATGWPPTDVASGGVDATAITRDREGNLYFGLLVADYSNAYRIKDEISHYDIKSPRGTIQKWHRKTGQLETIATGIRVPYSLAFNAVGDLFLTDQEGETWMPNGNPLDELNHIVPGKNYGFPPRHDKWLPDLISEPPVVSFGPQHQSTCGLTFNDPEEKNAINPGRGLFGPTHWQGDAFVAGESRGKIWRVRMAKTAQGYIGQETLFARLTMLTMDLAISPRGDLYVCCHSGAPDWGTGPKGEGRIFRIRYSDRDAPQPLLAHVINSTNATIVFDRPIPLPTRLATNVVEFGDFVSAADRFESLKPPYQVVQFQESTPRGKLPVFGVTLTNDNRALAVATAPHPLSVTYAATLDMGNVGPVDIAYDLSGIKAMWQPAPGNRSPAWHGCLPHLDMAASGTLVRASRQHEEFFQNLKSAGRLTLECKLQLPENAARLRLDGNNPFTLSIEGKEFPARESSARSGRFSVLWSRAADESAIPIQIVFQTSDTHPPELHIAYQNASEEEWRAVPTRAFLQPWAPPVRPVKMPEKSNLELAGGDWQDGRNVFFGDKASCAQCHRIRGEGGFVGPDLSNLVSRDLATVLRDIVEPNASINPDYVSYTAFLHNQEELSGTIRSQNTASVRLALSDGTDRTLSRADIKELRPSIASLMPEGLLDSLNEKERRDLATFLLHEPPRRQSEGNSEFAKHLSSTKLRLLLVAGEKDHGPGEHDYPAWQKEWSAHLSTVPGLEVTTAWTWPKAEQFDKTDVAIFYFWNHDWSAARLRDIDQFLKRGGGIVLLHSACISDNDPEALAERFGLAAQPQRTKYRHGPLDLKFPTIDGKTGTNIFFLDESYWPMIEHHNKPVTVATAQEEDRDHPMIWKHRTGAGRVFGSILGHYTWTWQDREFQRIICEGILWAAGQKP